MKKALLSFINRIGVVLIIISIILCSFVGCSVFEALNGDNELGDDSGVSDSTNEDQDKITENDKLYYGFSNEEPGEKYKCAYKSDKCEFDINNVTLTFSFGGIFGPYIDLERENGGNDFPYGFDIYFSNDDGNLIHVKHVDENYVSEKYNVKSTFVNNQQFLEFNYSEAFTIPSELFSKVQGVIYFDLWGKNIGQDQETEMPFSGVRLYYKLDDNRVTLSDKPIQQGE